MKKSYEMDMCNGPVLKKMLIFTLPLIFSSNLQLLFNAADIVVIGKFAGDNSMGAVGANTALINLLTNAFIGLSVGANVLASRKYGAKKYDELKKTVHTAMALSVISGIFLTIIGCIFAPVFLEWMMTPEDIIGLASVYLRILFLGMPAMMVYNFGAAILRSIGDTKRPLYFLMISGVLNVLLNLLFVIVFKMDVAGVALATICSQYLSAFLVVRCMIKEKGPINLVLKDLRVHREQLFGILRVGFPAGCQGVIFALSNVVIQSSINSFGKICVSGNAAAQSIEGFIYISMNSFYQAAISFTSQNVGAGRYDRIKKITASALVSVIITGVVLGWTAYLMGDKLMAIYTDSNEVIIAGLGRMRVIATTYALCGVMDVLVGILRGLGYSVIPMIVSLIGACGLRLLWLGTVFKMEQFHTEFNVYVSYPISWIVTILAHVITLLIIAKKIKKSLAENKVL